MSLLLCENCERHIRATESRCPFCDAAHTPVKAVTTAASGWTTPLSRAAIVFVGASAIAACGDKDGQGPPPVSPSADSGSPATPPTTPTPPAGKPDGGATSENPPANPPSNPPMPVALYGVPPVNSKK